MPRDRAAPIDAALPGEGRAREEERLRGEMRRLAGEHPRFGYRRVRQLLMRDGWSLSPSRAQRLWRQEGLIVPSKRRKRRRLGSSANSCTRRRAEHRNHVWSYDFVMDRTDDTRRL
ncbi:MAG: IS3 family transposase, partial [Myxococcales bacterium]|nr:IS3 family transposase [Myxococcales bacterium]